MDFLAAYHDIGRAGLGVGIGRDDGAAGIGAAILRQLADCQLDALVHLDHRQAFADHTGGADEHFARLAAERCGSDFLLLMRVLHALLARAGIGAARVRHDGMSLAARYDFLRYIYRRRCYLVRSERACYDRFFLCIDNREIAIAALLDAGSYSGSLEAPGVGDTSFG